MRGSKKSLPQSIVFERANAGSVTVSISALERMKNLVRDSVNVETGGILVGHNVGSNIQITEASDPGPAAERSATYFLRDTEHCRKFLARSYEGTKADYVGEWHSHVISLQHLSEGDLGTLVNILVDPDYDFVSFAVLLVIAEDQELKLLVYLAERLANRKHKEIKVVELYRGEFPEHGP